MKQLSQVNWAHILRPHVEQTGAWRARTGHRPLERTPEELLAVSGTSLEAVGEEAAVAYLSDPALRKLDSGIAELLDNAFGEPVALGA